MATTLAQARTLFSRYGGQGNSLVERLNLVIAHLLTKGNWTGSKVDVRFVVQPDEHCHASITLPREFENILAGNFECGGQPIPVRSDWYSSNPSGPGITTCANGDIGWYGYGGLFTKMETQGFRPYAGRYTTFATWTTPKKLRIKLEQNENPGQIIFRGTLNGEKIYSTINGVWSEGVALDYTGSTTVTTTQQFDAPPYQIIKQLSKGRISLFTVDADAVEVAVGLYDLDEVLPSYRRFRVPATCQIIPPATISTATTFLCICKKSYVPLVDENDELLIFNFAAIRYGLDALLKSDASDYDRENQLWAMAEKELITEEENQVGSGAQGTVQVEDSFMMESFPVGL